MTVVDFPGGGSRKRLSDRLGLYRFDPLGFVLHAFPWGKAGTALAGESGPEAWQREVLATLGRRLDERDRSPVEAVRLAVASGHGIGKSALVAWIVLWALSTVPDTRGVVTANTEGQLRTKTWAELAKWHALSVNRSWFTYTATSLHSARPGRDRTWRVDAITWSENNTEAIAGLHNKGRRAFALFDEASSIADGVWETIEGALTDADTDLFWLAFGNPTRTTGRFRECFAGGRFAHRWQPQQIDSRSVSMTNKAQIATWVADYGEDSDFVRVRVKGEFPRAGTLQFIDGERVRQAIERPLPPEWNTALVMGVDIARHGGDQTVIRFRRGLDARSIPAVKFRIPDLMVTAGRVMELVNAHSPDAVFVDGTGIGWGVVDRLAQLGCSTVRGVDFGGRADRGDGVEAGVRYANKRAEMWGTMKDWCRVGCLPDDRALAADLTAVDYGYDASDAILLEKKDDMRRRGLASPDDGDALALTFAWPVFRRDAAEDRRVEEKLQRLRRYVV
ncbi:terminase [Reyranella sp.]|uniref:terminase n=1 Tax=Reyranella sp. TaxID=1929291 RepID=UPI003BAA6120